MCGVGQCVNSAGEAGTSQIQAERAVDRQARKRRKSGREKVREKKAAGSDPGAAGVGREDAAAFRAAARFIRGDEGADRHGAQGPERREREQTRIAEWALAEGRVIHDRDLESLPLISNSTSEHEVRGRPADQRVVKKTWPGCYGQIPIWRGGRVEREPAMPSEYLNRQALQNEVFSSDLEASKR